MEVLTEVREREQKVPMALPLLYQASMVLQEKINEVHRIKTEGHTGVPLWEKYSLSIEEAAEYFGIGEKRLRSLLAENPGADFRLEVGTHVRIKREKFTQFLNCIGVV